MLTPRPIDLPATQFLIVDLLLLPPTSNSRMAFLGSLLAPRWLAGHLRDATLRCRTVTLGLARATRAVEVTHASITSSLQIGGRECIGLGNNPRATSERIVSWCSRVALQTSGSVKIINGCPSSFLVT
jgi:hypothetical protein